MRKVLVYLDTWLLKGNGRVNPWCVGRTFLQNEDVKKYVVQLCLKLTLLTKCVELKLQRNFKCVQSKLKLNPQTNKYRGYGLIGNIIKSLKPIQSLLGDLMNFQWQSVNIFTLSNIFHTNCQMKSTQKC